MEEFAKVVLERTELSPEIFSMYVAFLDLKGRAASTAAGYRSAFNYYCECRCKQITAQQDAQITRMIKGMKYRGGDVPSITREAIDSGRLAQLIEVCKILGKVVYAEGFVFTWFSGYRHKSVMKLKVKDVRFDTLTGTKVYTERMKSANAAKARPGTIGNLKEVDNLTGLLKRRCARRGPEELVFPGWCSRTANAIIRTAAEKFKWGQGQWVVHSLRHGAAREYEAMWETEVNTLEDVQAMTRKRFGWTNIESKANYDGSKKRRWLEK